jgi:hypothetical protein
MTKHTFVTLSALTALFLGVLARCASAEMMFDPQHYHEMVDASSARTIAPGTRITLQNWRQYKDFMPVWLQAAYSGDYQWRIGSGPEFTITVGPTTDFPLPRKFREDTEKYKGQDRLEKTSWGGYTIKGYTAGVPFPNPAEPDLAAKVMYNGWLPFRPFVSRYYTWDRIVDSYGNVSKQETDDTFFELAYLSDEGYPAVTELQLQPMDPTKLPELYVFLPSLRRSLRLSSAARCTPLLGNDYIADDGAWLPSNFAPKLLGEKKMLTIVMDPKFAYDPKSYAGGGSVRSGSFPGWPVAGTNHWELRDYYVVDLLALPILGNYCYSHRIYYLDKQTWIVAQAGAENYDRSGRLYKMLWTAQVPIKFRGETTTYSYATSMSMAMDFQNQHVTWNNDTPVQIDNEVSAESRDPVNATPAALARVMQ